MKPLNIAYITETSPDDKHAWSGTVHYIFKALQKQGHTMVALGPKQPIFIGLICKIINKITLLFLNKRFDYRHSTRYSKAFGRIFTKELWKINYDIVVVCGGTEYCAYLKTTKPLYIIVDRTIEGAINYHTILSNLIEFSKKQSIVTDKKAMFLASKVFFSSQWAANHAKHYYQLPNSKISILPFGANLDDIPTKEIALQKKQTTEWKLLLIGTYWKNKGVDIAIHALDTLIKNNINATLTIVGCTPPLPLVNPKITIIPFIDKNSAEGIKQMWNLFITHHFFILPTRFDCTPIVFCEASSFGLPIISSNTGGVEGHIREGQNGFLISYNDNGEKYAQKIMEIISTENAYSNLCISTRKCYDDELNWEKWATQFTKEVSETIS